MGGEILCVWTVGFTTSGPASDGDRIFSRIPSLILMKRQIMSTRLSYLILRVLR